jgi:Holliday junction resolvasome RuvABC endonuclease subunit|tara:strand:- start:450 stop:1049 length:600 start_codon:yes stop_codon:yes gene_type:complete
MNDKYILALDASTFCTGYAVWNITSNKFETAGHVPLKNVDGLHAKVDTMVEALGAIKENSNITEIIIEDIITKFIAGKSNIKTIITLASFNAIIQRKCYEMFGETPIMMNVIRARNLADCKTPRGVNTKNFILRRICELHPEVKELLPMMKTKAEFAKESYDVSDAIVIARARAAQIFPPVVEKPKEPEPIPEQELLPF